MKIIKAIQINYQLFTFLKNEQSTHNVEKTSRSTHNVEKRAVHPQRRKNEQSTHNVEKRAGPPTT